MFTLFIAAVRALVLRSPLFHYSTLCLPLVLRLWLFALRWLRSGFRVPPLLVVSSLLIAAGVALFCLLRVFAESFDRHAVFAKALQDMVGETYTDYATGVLSVEPGRPLHRADIFIADGRTLDYKYSGGYYSVVDGNYVWNEQAVFEAGTCAYTVTISPLGRVVLQFCGRSCSVELDTDSAMILSVDLFP